LGATTQSAVSVATSPAHIRSVNLSIGGGGFNGTLILSAIETYTLATKSTAAPCPLGGSGHIGRSSSGPQSEPGAMFVFAYRRRLQARHCPVTGTVALGATELTGQPQHSTFGGSPHRRAAAAPG